MYKATQTDLKSQLTYLVSKSIQEDNINKLTKCLREYTQHFSEVYDSGPVLLKGNNLTANVFRDREDPKKEEAQFSIDLSSWDITPPQYHIFLPRDYHNDSLATALEIAGIGTRIEKIKFGFTWVWLFQVNLNKVEL